MGAGLSQVQIYRIATMSIFIIYWRAIVLRIKMTCGVTRVCITNNFTGLREVLNLYNIFDCNFKSCEKIDLKLSIEIIDFFNTDHDKPIRENK